MEWILRTLLIVVGIWQEICTEISHSDIYDSWSRLFTVTFFYVDLQMFLCFHVNIEGVFFSLFDRQSKKSFTLQHFRQTIRSEFIKLPMYINSDVLINPEIEFNNIFIRSISHNFVIGSLEYKKKKTNYLPKTKHTVWGYPISSWRNTSKAYEIIWMQVMHTQFWYYFCRLDVCITVHVVMLNSFPKSI